MSISETLGNNNIVIGFRFLLEHPYCLVLVGSKTASSVISQSN